MEPKSASSIANSEPTPTTTTATEEENKAVQPETETQQSQLQTAQAEPETETPTQTPTTQPQPVPQEETKTTYLKAMPLKDITDLETVKNEVQNGNIVILKITPLANKNIVDVSKAVNELYNFAESINGDIARLGEERIVVCPQKIRIWREKKPAQNEPLPTAA